MQRHQTFAAILFVVSASLIGCESAKAPLSVPPRPPATAPVPSSTPDVSPMAQDTVTEVANEPEIRVSAEQIAKDYSTDAEAAGVKYRRKLVRIEGKIHKLEIKDGLRILMLEGDGALDIHCGISLESWPLYKSLKVDQTVSVVGEVFGISDNAVSVGQGQIAR